MLSAVLRIYSLRVVDSQGLDALMLALKTWNGGVIIISHDERFITTVADEVNQFLSECYSYWY